MCEKNTKIKSEKPICSEKSGHNKKTVHSEKPIHSEKPGHGWGDFQSRPESSFKQLPESHSTRDWWITAVILLATAIWAVWFATKGAPEVREFIKLFSIITGGMLVWIFGFQMLAWALREFGLWLGFSKKVLDRKYYFYGRYGRW